MKSLWKFFLRSKGWRTSIVFPYHHLNKYIVIVGPHTTNWDFIIGLAYRNILDMNYVGFLAKHQLFKPPFGWIFRKLGGIPVDRTSSHNLVDAVAELFDKRERFAIAIAPEGTRKKVEKLKTGFYFIAAKASVPIVMVGLDYKLKSVLFSEPLYPSNQVKDFETIYSFYSSIYGKYPELGLMDLKRQNAEIHTAESTE
ncbi:MAG TPA: 1-acyl-sn-glycerol-3-phosphate acyltransferase [Chryseosolibacter sp.]